MGPSPWHRRPQRPGNLHHPLRLPRAARQLTASLAAPISPSSSRSRSGRPRKRSDDLASTGNVARADPSGSAFVGTAPAAVPTSTAGTNQCSPAPPSPSTPARTTGMVGDSAHKTRAINPTPASPPPTSRKLKLKWAFGFPDDTRAVAQPSIVGGRIFVGSHGGKVYSLDLATGCTYWSFNAGAIVRDGITLAPRRQPLDRLLGDAAAFAYARRTNRPTDLESEASTTTPSPASPAPASSTTDVSISRCPRRRTRLATTRLRLLQIPAASPLWTPQPARSSGKPTPSPRKPRCTNDRHAGQGQVRSPSVTSGDPQAPPSGPPRPSTPSAQPHLRLDGQPYTGVDVPTSDAVLAFDLGNRQDAVVQANDRWRQLAPRLPERSLVS